MFVALDSVDADVLDLKRNIATVTTKIMMTMMTMMIIMIMMIL